MAARSTPLADGDAGTAQTVREMERVIEHGKQDPTIRELAAQILRSVRAFDWQAEYHAIFNWCKRNIRFTRDADGVEMLHGAADTARLGIGDCDDFTILVCSLLGAVGHTTRIVTVATDGRDPSQFTHVYPEVEINGQWIPMDLGRKRPRPFEGVRDFYRRQEWSGGASAEMSYAPSPAARYLTAAPGSPRLGLSGVGSYAPRSHAPAAPRPDLGVCYDHRPKCTGVIGVGNYGRPMGGRNGLGQPTDTTAQILSSVAQDITAGGQATSEIIQAADQPTTTASSIALMEQEQAAAQAQAAANPLSSLTSSPILLLLLIGGGLLLVMRSKD